MRILSILIVSMLAVCGARAANPAFQDFFGTNGIIIQTNGNKVQVRAATTVVTNILGSGSVLVTSNNLGTYTVLGLATNGVTNIVILTNGVSLGTPSALNFIYPVTGLLSGATADIGVNSAAVTTGTVANANIWTNQSGRIRPIVYPTFRIYPTNDDAASPILIMGGAGASNWMAAGYGGTLRDYSLFSANIVEEGDLNNRNLAVASAQDTGGARYGYAAFETKTNQSMVFTETLITGGGVNRFIAGHVDGTGNVITLVTNTTEAFKVDGVGGISLMKAVPQNWPDAQGAAATVLTNDGSGNLGWGTVSAGAAGVTTNDLIHTNVTWVAKNGNNATGVPGNFARPYLSISNAVQASPEGTLVVVEPGLYNESVLFKSGVNFHMPSGVIVSQSVNLPVFFDDGNTVTSRLSGDFTIIHTGDASQTDGINILGDDTDITLYGGTINIHGSGDYGIQMARGNLKAVGTTIYSAEHGLSHEIASGVGNVSFIGTIFATNNAAFLDGGNTSSNYLRGYFSSVNYHAIQHTIGYILLEDSELISFSAAHHTIDFQGGDLEVRRGKITATDAESAITKYGNGFLILDDVQLNAGDNANYSIDNDGDTSNGTTELRTPIWANKPIRPDMIVASNGFTRLSRYLSITTNDYQFPAVQGAAGTVLTNDGAGVLGWGSVGGSATAAGSTYQVQYNSNNVFDADATFFYNVLTNELVISNNVAYGPKLSLKGAGREFSFKVEDGTNRIVSLNHVILEMGSFGNLVIKTNQVDPPQNGSTSFGNISTRWRDGHFWTNATTNLHVLGGTLGAGQLLTDPLGNGEAVWGTNVSSLLVTNLTVVNEFKGPVTFQTNVFITNLFLGGVEIRTNQYTTNISFTPVLGSFWFGGTNGIPNTNGPRVSMEWIPVMRSWRIGEIADGVHPSNLGGQGTNYWNATNVGVLTFAHGSNVMAKANFSSIGGGRVNLILTNSDNSVIGGGYNNFIDTNSHSSTIGGGGKNEMYGRPTAFDNVNRTISGGSNNVINGLITRNATIGGGQDNAITTDAVGGATVAGGVANLIRIGGSYGFIGGGNQNTIDDNAVAGESEGAVIAGGIQNVSRGLFSFIGGGKANNLLAGDSDGSVIVGGSSNTVGIAAGDNESKYASIVGGFQNSMAQNATFSFIGGGLLNTMGGNNTNSVIGGGFQNDVQANAQLASVLSGKQNIIDGNGDFGLITGGVSNNIGAAMSTAAGNFITNTTASSVEIGHGAAGGNNRKARVDVNGLKVLTYGGHAAAVGGTILITNTPIASAGAAETNLQVVTIGAHVLTNNNERLLVRASGRFAATSNAKEVKLVFGSQEVFASGSQVANTGAWTLDAEIIRTGNTSQSVNASFHGGTNTAFITESSLDLAQTNGIATVLKITGTAAGDGDITNRTLTVEWRPAP